MQFLADRRSSSRGWKKFISLEAVTAPSSSLLHEGGLLIRCSVSRKILHTVLYRYKNKGRGSESFSKLDFIYLKVELESRDDRGANVTGSTSSGLNETPNVGLMSPSSLLLSNVAAIDNLEMKNEGFDPGSSTKACSPNNCIGQQNTIGSLSSPVSYFVFDASSQQFIDSMKYTDLTLSVEPPGALKPIEIPCHKFMLAKKVIYITLNIVT